MDADRRREVLDRRALNRATLQRQLLLRRDVRTAESALGHLLGLQAQEPQEPFVGLWSRLADFRPRELDELLGTRRAVRTLLMRRTLHLVTAEDCLTLRPVHQPMLVARITGTLGRRLAGVDLAELAAAGEPHVAAEPRTLPEVGRLVGHRWPDAAARDLGDALSSLVPLLQVPPRGLWRQRGLPAVVARLRPALRSFSDERGRELLDVPEGPLPGTDRPAPVRFLPAFDNAVLGYDDRSRIIRAEHRGLSVEGARFVLVDGFVSGTWTTTARDDGSVAVDVRALRPLSRDERDGVDEEGWRLAAFLGDGRPGSLTISPPG